MNFKHKFGQAAREKGLRRFLRSSVKASPTSNMNVIVQYFLRHFQQYYNNNIDCNTPNTNTNNIIPNINIVFKYKRRKLETSLLRS